jgi:hypothetical protein
MVGKYNTLNKTGFGLADFFWRTSSGDRDAGLSEGGRRKQK